MAVPESKIAGLVAMGFPRQQVIEALIVCNMDEAMAASYLLGS